MASTKAPDSSRRSDRSRRAIHDAALALVGEVGYRRTTIEGIAARAGVGKQTIYRWWPSKAAVLMEALPRPGGPGRRGGRTAVRRHRAGHP
ncbi:AcrR family transcriptional regulator [Streptomyces sp. HB372]|nr:AcrR family transcriptional regulator [Streptomyces sp. HB372]